MHLQELSASGEWTAQEQDEHISTLTMKMVLKAVCLFRWARTSF